MKYSRKKFSSFNPDKQLKVITSFIEDITASWDNKEQRTALLQNLGECLDSLDRSFPYSLEQVGTISKNIAHSKTVSDFLYAAKDIWHNHSIKLQQTEMCQPTGKPVTNDEHKDYPFMALTVILDNLRSAFNVGAIIRTSECFRIKKLIFSGYSPTPENSKVRKTARSTEDKIAWEHCRDPIPLIKSLKSQGNTIIALETAENAALIHQTAIPQPAALILGNEALGVDSRVLEHANLTVQIPVRGWKNSLNVATAYGIACFEIYRQWIASGLLDR